MYLFTDVRLLEVNGRPAILFRMDDMMGYDPLRYKRAANAEGTSWAGGSVSIDSNGEQGSIAIVDGNPAVAYYDNSDTTLQYRRATDADGAAWAAAVTVDTNLNVGQYCSLFVVNGRPGISYYDSANGNLKYCWASDATGSAWETPVVVDNDTDVGLYTSLATNRSDEPMISYYDQGNGDLKLAIAYNTSGTSWGDYTMDDRGDVGKYTSLLNLDSEYAISYYDVSNGSLKFTYRPSGGGPERSYWKVLTLDDNYDTGTHTCQAELSGNVRGLVYFDVQDEIQMFVTSGLAPTNSYGRRVGSGKSDRAPN